METHGVLLLRLRAWSKEDTDITCGWQQAGSGCKCSGGQDQDSKFS